MALRHILGAEDGIIVAGLGATTDRIFNAIGGTPTINTDASFVRSGSKSYKFVAAATNPWAQVAFPASQSVIYVLGYWYPTSVSPSTNVYLCDWDEAAGSDPFFQLTTAGKVRMGFGATVIDGPSVSANAWFGVEAEIDVHANPNVIRWRVWTEAGGWVSQSGVSIAQAASTIPLCAYGLQGPSSGITVYLDDLVDGAGTTPGEHYDTGQSQGGIVLRYRPNADGTHSHTATNFGYNAAGADVATNATDVNTYLDDDDQSSITDFIRQDGSAAGEYLEVTFPDEATETSPRAIGITSVHHAAGTGADQQGLHYVDSTGDATVWSANDVSDTSAHVRHKVLSKAADGTTALTQTIVNSGKVRIGYSGDVNAAPYWDNVSLNVLWTESSSPTATSAITLQPAAAAATGSLTITGTSAITVQAAAVAATGVGGAVGTSAVTLQPTAVAATATETLSATGALTLQAATVAATGSLTITGTSAISLQPTAVAAVGIGGAVGTSAVTLEPVSVDATGDHTETGASPSGDGALALQPVAASGTGTLTITGSAVITLPSVMAAALGSEVITGASAMTLPTLTVAATATETLTASAALTLQPVAIAGSGNNGEQVVAGPAGTISGVVSLGSTSGRPALGTGSARSSL